MGNGYLFSAYAITLVLFGLYAWSVIRRQACVRKDIDDLGKKLPGGSPPQG